MITLSRRHFLVSACALASGGAQAQAETFTQRCALLEGRHGGRLGVTIIDTATNQEHAHRGDDRFAMCSTHKLLSASFALWRAERGEENMSRRVAYSKSDLVTWSPVTEKFTDAGMSVSQLCAAAMTLSDNTAANLLFASFGGPAGLTKFVRALGDYVTRSDRIEPELNEATPGDLRDTSTPRAFARTMRKLLVEDGLSASSRAQLTQWLLDNKTGDDRLRAGLPTDWRVGDKTGTGEHNTTNDVAILWPPDRAPLIAVVFYAEADATLAQRNAILANVARIIPAIP
ncbi:MAG: class A beta-lactamase [Beijerinckiaceae bacterium]|nr:class A beta-lactamase [Beijerinckiaceae bacterium]